MKKISIVIIVIFTVLLSGGCNRVEDADVEIYALPNVNYKGENGAPPNEPIDLSHTTQQYENEQSEADNNATEYEYDSDIDFLGVHIPTRSVLDNVTQISIGRAHTLAIRDDGSLWAWGANWGGQLGVGSAVKEYSPSPMMVMTDVIYTSAGLGHSMAIRSDGSLWAWGGNQNGQLGDGTTENRYLPIKIMDDVIQVSASIGYATTHRTMAIRTDGSLWAWGSQGLGGDEGLIGDGTTINRYSPVKIMDDVVQVSAGYYHTMAVKVDGSLWGWGENSRGILGDGTTETQTRPVWIMDDVVQVSAGAVHTMALKTDGSLWVWGGNWEGQLGDGTTINRYTPIKIMDEVVQISAGYVASAATRADGSLWAWGSLCSWGWCFSILAEYGCSWGSYLDGQISDEALTSSLSPIKIMDDAVAVAAGFNHTMASRTDGSLWAWGHNWNGLFGDVERPMEWDIWDIRVHHSPTEDSSVDKWISVEFYWEGSISLCIPSTWHAIEYIEGYYTPNSYLAIFGEGAYGTIRLYGSVSPIGNPYYVIREFSSRERFYFDNGQEGYMLENPSVIFWFQPDTSIGVSLQYGDRREVFNDNKDVILQIVRTLR